jgi:perosamine synthetase
VTRAPRIPVAGPWITEHEVEAVAAATRTAWYEHAGDEQRAFESAFAAYVGREHAIALPSCTAGLHLSLLALGVGPGDEVIVSDATWIASAAPISYVGATPCFVDADPETWCIDPEAVAAAITDRTRAVIAVDLYGSMPDMTRLEAVCAAQGVSLVEDAAEALGSTFAGARAGSFGATAVFSFHGSKTLTTGEGGMVVTDDPSVAARMRFLADHGRAPGDVSFLNAEIAYKYRMSALQAALGAAQLQRVDELVAKKQEIFSWYRARLGERDDLALNPEPPGVTSSYWMSTVVVDEATGLVASALADDLDRAGIDSRPFFHPLSSLPAYSQVPGAAAAHERNLVAARLGTYGLNLPSALRIEEGDVDRVCAVVAASLDRAVAASRSEQGSAR